LQWLGRFGKIDNGQVVVYMALNCREKVTLKDTGLFLPKCWTKAKKRMRQAGVPEIRYLYQNKKELAIDMIKKAKV